MRRRQQVLTVRFYFPPALIAVVAAAFFLSFFISFFLCFIRSIAVIQFLSCLFIAYELFLTLWREMSQQWQQAATAAVAAVEDK